MIKTRNHKLKLLGVVFSLVWVAQLATAQGPRRFAVGSTYGCRLLGELSKPVKFDNASSIDSSYDYVTVKAAQRGIKKDQTVLKDNLPAFKKLLAEYKKKRTLPSKKLKSLAALAQKLTSTSFDISASFEAQIAALDALQATAQAKIASVSSQLANLKLCSKNKFYWSTEDIQRSTSGYFLYTEANLTTLVIYTLYLVTDPYEIKEWCVSPHYQTSSKRYLFGVMAKNPCGNYGVDCSNLVGPGQMGYGVFSTATPGSDPAAQAKKFIEANNANYPLTLTAAPRLEQVANNCDRYNDAL